MRLVFERGDERRPKGHALLYFHAAGGDVLASYLIVPPVHMDIAKYIPPMFAGQGFGGAAFQAPPIVPLPPVPEKVPSLGELQVLAEERDDDLVSGGDVASGEFEQLITVVSEAAQLYLHLYEDFARSFPSAPQAEPGPIGGPSAEELTFALMSERERLSELVKLTGTLRYAVDGHDQAAAQETLTRMKLLTKHLPAKYWPDRIEQAASTPGPSGAQLLPLYIERCYKLLAEDYAAVAQIDEQIKSRIGG